ncbi:pimeloyl-ACP methyl ester carboxylesterase [Motilibacter rhizosphaerae]|uniref:Pimeloyl-ACP methyl ester carboxylesterase n=1 Tax=Motilibacter rhizosphaerae TaxID=598652 RepID=A0A4Q7NAK8_9ACTN|nr:alpha/beta hydrolase [Motilibacter rhizosphaerae]RZS79382.1 pimeloyl-ACP methyl ester carboxylesterase [Motilibacter rhizosphaerae]
MAVLDASTALVEGPWEHRMVAAGGARFHVAEAGEGPLVLLLHGFPQFWWTWRHVIPALASAGVRAVAMDLRGYGASDKPPRGYDPATLASDVVGVVRALGAADAVVVGNGLGGLLGWTAAVAYPKQVRGLVAIGAPHPLRFRAAVGRDPAQLAVSRHVLGFQLPLLPERRLVEDDAAYVGHLLRAWSAQPPADEVVETYRQAMRIAGVAHSSLEYSRWAVRSLVRPDGARYARGMRVPVKAPVLHLHGAEDHAVLSRTAAGSAAHVTGYYRWQLVPGAGHFVQEEAPEVVVREVLAFLGEQGLVA